MKFRGDQKQIIAGVTVTLAILLIGGQWVMARQKESSEPRGPRGQMRAQMRDRMARELGLNDSQKKQFAAIEEKNEPKMRAIFEDKTLSREEGGKRMMAIRTQTDTEIRALMTPEQQAKFDAMQERMRLRGRGGPGGMGGPPPGMNGQGGPGGMGGPGGPDGPGGPPPGGPDGMGGPPPGGPPMDGGPDGGRPAPPDAQGNNMTTAPGGK